MATIEPIVAKFGCISQSLYEWVKRSQIDASERTGVTNEEDKRIKALERESKELPRANEILRTASAFSPGRSLIAS